MSQCPIPSVVVAISVHVIDMLNRSQTRVDRLKSGRYSTQITQDITVTVGSRHNSLPDLHGAVSRSSWSVVWSRSVSTYSYGNLLIPVTVKDSVFN
ncbi:hypothetical protein AHF37_05109 [Paragonimus kellicotti]|nr:hypothetical protein AHF37_05109 [Paragonimus kellicotti]